MTTVLSPHLENTPLSPEALNPLLALLEGSFLEGVIRRGAGGGKPFTLGGEMGKEGVSGKCGR